MRLNAPKVMTEMDFLILAQVSPVKRRFKVKHLNLDIIPDVNGYAVRIFDAEACELTFIGSGMAYDVALAAALSHLETAELKD